MECDTVKNHLMKLMLTNEYKRHVRKLLYTKLTSRNLILVVNAYCASLLRYSGEIVSWSQADLYKLDVMMRKQFTMHGAFSRNSEINHLYVP